MKQAFTPQQLEKLLQYASLRLHTTPEALLEAFQQGRLYGLSQKAEGEAAFSPEIAAKIQQLAQTPEQTAQLLNSPEVRQLIDRLLEKP